MAWLVRLLAARTSQLLLGMEPVFLVVAVLAAARLEAFVRTARDLLGVLLAAFVRRRGARAIPGLGMAALVISLG